MDYQLHLGDCLDVMRGMAAGSVDLVITSPPYNKGYSTGGGYNNGGLSQHLTGGYKSYADDLNPEQYREWQAEILRQCWRLLSDTGAIFYNHKPRVQAGILETFLDWNPQLPVRQIITWNPGGGINFAPTHYRPVCEWIVIFAKSDFRLASKSASGCGDLWTFHYDRDNSHPAPFPVALPVRILSTTSAKTVLDPFMGSGTTGVACIKTGRRFIGIEIDPTYHAIATRRIELAAAQPMLLEITP